jgi:hypothetical protein
MITGYPDVTDVLIFSFIILVMWYMGYKQGLTEAKKHG